MAYEMSDDTTVREQRECVARELFRTKGFEETSVTDLVEKLQIEEQTFYSTFRDMEELLEAVWSES